MTRGVEYTFRVMAGELHPFYITNSINGGEEPPAEGVPEVIYAGSFDAHGVPGDPYILKWTPDETVPDVSGEGD